MNENRRILGAPLSTSLVHHFAEIIYPSVRSRVIIVSTAIGASLEEGRKRRRDSLGSEINYRNVNGVISLN